MADAQRKEKTEKGGKPRLGPVLAWVIAPIVMFAFYETIFLLTVGMVPTLVAFIVDRYPRKFVAKTVGYLNFAGCLPFLLRLWKGSGGIESVLDVLRDPFTLLTMYAAAASGWLIFFVMPPLVTAWLAVSHEVKLQSVKSRQNGLIEEWGREVRKAAGVEEEQEEAEPAQPSPAPETSAAEPAS